MKHEPRYQKIAGIISGQVHTRVLLPGDRLPSQRNLSQQLKVSIGTVQRAYALLEDQGLIRPRQRSGYYVAPQKPAPIIHQGNEAFAPVPSGISVMETAISVVRSAARSGLVQMGSAIPDVGGKAVVMLHQALKRHALKCPNYEEDPQGYLPLRRQLARRSYATGKAVQPQDIVITAGCQEALTLALRCVTRPGDIIAVESPCYYGVLQAMEVLELKAVEIPTSPVDGIDTAMLSAIIEKWPVKAVLLTPSFSNPSGYLCPDAKKERIAAILRENDLPLIEDDVFSDLAFSGQRPKTIHSFDPDGRVILCGSISKALCPDLKIGWMMPGRYTQKARDLKFISSLGAPCHSQFALAEFLSGNTLERHIRSMISNYRKKQTLLLAAIHRHLPENCIPTRPLGGFLCWLKLPENVDGMMIYKEALKKGIAITPGEICSPAGRYKNYIRLSYALVPEAQIDHAMKIIAMLIAEQLKIQTAG